MNVFDINPIKLLINFDFEFHARLPFCVLLRTCLVLPALSQAEALVPAVELAKGCVFGARLSAQATAAAAANFSCSEGWGFSEVGAASV